jgi:predicted Ser/Thr protein kinase
LPLLTLRLSMLQSMGCHVCMGVWQVELNEDGTEVELGKGAFGVVVKGSYRMAPVAIKRLRDQSPEQQVAFLKEMAILRACRGSRYVVPFVGASLQPVSPPSQP